MLAGEREEEGAAARPAPPPAAEPAEGGLGDMLSGLWGSSEGEAGGGAQGQGRREEEDGGLLGALSAGVWGLGEALVRSPPCSFAQAASFAHDADTIQG